MAKKMPTKGAKAKKGAAGRAASRGKGNARNNPRAFKAASGPKSMQRQAHRALEKQERQYHVNLQDRSIEAATQPPIVVVVVGPSGVGVPLARPASRGPAAWGGASGMDGALPFSLAHHLDSEPGLLLVVTALPPP